MANGANVQRVRVRLYTVAGELVAKVEGAAGSAQATWDAQGLASGLYLAEAEALDANGGLVQHQVLKVTLVR